MAFAVVFAEVRAALVDGTVRSEVGNIHHLQCQYLALVTFPSFWYALLSSSCT